MAKARKNASQEEQISPDFLEALAVDPLAPVRAYMAKAGIEEAEAQYYVYRVVDDGTKPDAFLYKVKPEDFDPETLGKRYGSGVYRLKCYVKDEDHPNGVIRGMGIFPIEMPPGFKPEPAAATPAAVAAVVHPGEPSSFEKMMLQMFQAQSERTEKLLEAIVKRPEKNPLEDLKGLSEVMRNLIPAPAVTPAAPAGSSVTEVLSAAKMMVDISQGLSGGGDTESNGLVRGLGLIEKLIDRAPVPGQPQAGAEAAALAQPAAANALSVEEEEMQLLFKMFMRRALAAAAKNESAEAFAEEYYDDIPDADIMKISAADWFTVLVANVPDVKPFEAWFTRARAKILELAAADGLVQPAPPLALVSAPALTGTPAGDTLAGANGATAGGRPGNE